MSIFEKLNGLKTHLWANVLAIFGLLSALYLGISLSVILLLFPAYTDMLKFIWLYPTMVILSPVIILAIVALIVEINTKQAIKNPIILNNPVYHYCFWIGLVMCATTLILVHLGINGTIRF